MSRATTRDERPVFLSSGDAELFAILTSPTAWSNDVGVVIMSSGGWAPSPGRNRIWVRLARRLAATGFHSIRFDYHGVGESTGTADRYRLDLPFVDDAAAAVDHLQGNGLSDLVLVGYCFGARTALVCAEDLAGLRGVVMLAPPVLDFELGARAESLPLSTYVRRIRSFRSFAGLLSARRRRFYGRVLRSAARRAWAGLVDKRGAATPTTGGGGRRSYRFVSPNFARPFGDLVDRGVPVLILFGEDDEYRADFEQAKAGGLGSILARAGDLVTVLTLPDRVHNLTSLAVQDAVLDAVDAWLAELVQGAAATAAGAAGAS